FERHLKAVETSNMEEALQSFVLLQTNSADHEEFEAYIIGFLDHIDPSKNTKTSSFFASLPALIQSTILEKIATLLEEKETLKAYQILFDYIQYNSRHTYKYLVRIIYLLTLAIQSMDQLESSKYTKTLVTDLFPRLCKQRIVLTGQDTQPSVKTADGKQHISIPYTLFDQYILLGQRYYLENHAWEDLIQFTNTMLDCSGYTKLSQTEFVTHIQKFQYIQQKRVEQQSLDVVFMSEYKAVAAQFVCFSYQYYRAVCMLDSKEEKSCLIPICAIKPNMLLAEDNFLDSSSSTLTTSSLESDNEDHECHKKRTRKDSTLVSEKRPKLTKDNRGEGLNAFCMNGVDHALQILSKAADCMRHLVDLWDWACQTTPVGILEDVYDGWEEELVQTIQSYELSFDLANAVLLTRSDLALSLPSVSGNLSKALELSQSICDRIEIYRQNHKQDATESDIPFLFAFRVLYNIGVIYLLVGSLPQSILEIAIILSVFPIPQHLNSSDFLADQIDCKTVAAVFQDHEFGLMRVTQEGLVARCIKHLIVGLDNAANTKSTGMASIDRALKWDRKAGQMIVLMQYGWHYWSTKTDYWHKIITRIKEKKVFRNRSFLEYVYEPGILQAFQHLHTNNQVTLDIIPPEFAIRTGYRYVKMHMDEEDNLPSLSSITSALKSSIVYQPTYSNPILPSTTMSPTFYSASTQKNAHVDWMSPSFYYSRPATSVMLPSTTTVEEKLGIIGGLNQHIVMRCLEYR
ncbi:hypothetical protein CU098_002908, partial [Rhizopus stolonifer]